MMDETVNKIVAYAKTGLEKFSFEDKHQILAEVIEQLETEKDTCMQMLYWSENQDENDDE